MKKLSDYAREHNVTYRTAYNHFKRGLIENSYQLPNGTIIIKDNSKSFDKEDLIQDFISIITSFTARIYGQRRTKRKTEKLIKELTKED